MGLLAIILSAGTTLTWWSLHKTDQEMRRDLLKKAVWSAEAINLSSMRRLTGTKQDLKAADYQQLKYQLRLNTLSNPAFRFSYVMGRKADGDIFFYLDSEAQGSKDESPPGQIYAEAPPDFLRTFSDRLPLVSGPDQDRWGTWVTGLVPLIDPSTILHGLATPNDAKAMVQVAIAHYRKHGLAEFLKEVNNPEGLFRRGELYVYVYDLAMTMQAHPLKPELVGKNQVDKKDWTGGKYFRREIQQIATTAGHGWVDYMYENPLSKRLDSKTAYVEKIDNLIVCSGAYKGTGDIIGVFGLDINATDWNKKLWRAALPPILFVLALVLLTSGWFGLAQRRKSDDPTVKPFLFQQRSDALFVFALGAILTFYFAYWTNSGEQRLRDNDFQQIAASHSASIATKLTNLRDSELKGLVSFLKELDEVTPEHFARYASHLSQNPIVKAWAWVPLVKSEERETFEKDKKREGPQAFRIWEKGAHGEAIAASQREHYFPVSLIFPPQTMGDMAGFDLGAEPATRLVMDAARQSQYVMATEAFPLVEGTEHKNAMHLIAAVDDPNHPGVLLGYAVAVLSFDTLVQSVADTGMAQLAISYLHDDGTPQALAHTGDSDLLSGQAFSFTRPLFTFGHVFTITVTTGPAYLAAHTTHSAWIVLLAGFLLCTLLAFVVALVQNQRLKLERLVAERTVSLQKSQERLSQLAEHSRTVAWEVDENGVFRFVSHVAEQVFGYSALELIGGMHFIELRAAFRNLISQIQTRSGDLIWVTSSGLPLFDSEGRLTGYRGSDTDTTQSKLAEDARQTEMLRYETLSNTVPAMIFHKDRHFVYRSANRAFETFMGLAPDTIDGKTDFDFFPKSVAERFRADDEALIASGQPLLDKIERLVRPNGNVYWVQTCKAPICDHLGEVTGLVGIAMDIGKLMQAEEALRANEERFRALVVNTQSIIFSLDREGFFTFVSPSWTSLLGHPTQDVDGKHFSAFTHPDELSTLLQFLRTTYNENRTLPGIDFRLLHRDGRIHYFRAVLTPLCDERGDFLMFIGNAVDFTERKLAEEELVKTHRELQHILNASSQVAIIATDCDGLITLFNTGAERMLGYTSEEMVRKQKPPVFHLEAEVATRAKVLEEEFGRPFSGFEVFIARVVNGGHEELEWTYVRKDGQRLSVSLAITAIRDEAGLISGVLGVALDISDIVRTEAELRESNRQLLAATSLAESMATEAKAASTAKSEFLANMSHEIRTPMNGVIGMTGLLLDTDLSEEQRRFAQTVRASGEALLGLINDILDFSKIEAGKLDLEVLDFDLQMLLDDLSDSLAPRIQGKGLELACSIEPQIPVLLRGDPGRLRQVLTNLCGNASKFTVKGEIAIHVSVVEESDRDILLRFAVRDTGIGIPKEKLSLLFNKFTQVDASTTRKYGGTGLGLAISKQLAELMGGEVGVSSEEGAGSEFWFTARLIRQLEAKQPDTTVPSLRGVRVLIVDDNATNLRILSVRMNAWGMRPVECEGGLQALQALLKATQDGDPFLVAVVDIQMPVMSGDMLGQAIHSDPRIASTRLVALTSIGLRGDAKKYAELGFVAYLTKPVRHLELRSTLTLVLEKNPNDSGKTHLITRHTVREEDKPFLALKARVLLAEDNFTNQQVALGLLAKLGLSADAVADGHEVLKAVEAIPYAVILMDCQMPNMDGYEATRCIRQKEASVPARHIPIIAMTANAMLGDREKCLEAGMDDYIPKPVSFRALQEALYKWLMPDKIGRGD